jgi:prepilin-type N-terminal cleavage/methylation domain-containing protein
VKRAQKLYRAGGFTMVELVVVIALIAIVGAIAVPRFIGFVQAQRTRGAAREVLSLLNQARQLAITGNTPFSVEIQTTPRDRLRFCSGTATPCPAGSVWMGTGTDPGGWIGLANRDRITLGPPITFNGLGAATAAGTLRVQAGQGGACLDIVVSLSGRIRIAAVSGCP